MVLREAKYINILFDAYQCFVRVEEFRNFQSHFFFFLLIRYISFPYIFHILLFLENLKVSSGVQVT